MKKIKLYIAASIDGYIAQSNGDLDWLTEYPINSETNYGYNDFFESIDTIVMGGRTYRDILCMDVVWPYTNKMTYVITHNPMRTKENIHFITDNIVETISQLRKEKGKNIWLVGGGEIIAMLLNEDLIDEMIITYIPVILGNGIPLFPNNPKESAWILKKNASYKNGAIQVLYERKIK
jgi:dihydrofolate reductase